MLVIGHRGALHEDVENSFAAFRKAIEGGAERLELDVHLTRDHELVIMHDSDLKRTCGVDGMLQLKTRQELKDLRLANGEEIPFLDQVLEEMIPLVEINIEIKGNSVVLAERVNALIEQMSVGSRVIISSFEPEPLEYFKEKAPSVRRACLIGDFPRWPNIAARSPLLFMQRIGTDIIHPWVPLVDENFMDQARARDWKVYPYCSAKGEEDEDRLGLWESLQALGVHGLCTNYPREMRLWVDGLMV